MQRNTTLDSTKIILSFMVIAVHCSFLSEYNSLIYYIVINSLFRICIPVFFIINGYYLYFSIKKNEIKPWLIKATIIYLFLMVLYAHFWLDLTSFNLWKIIFKITFGYFHLWYLPAMIFGSLCLFFLKDLPNRVLFFISMFLFIIGLTIQYTARFHLLSHYILIDKITNNLSFYRNFLFIGFPFITLGFLIHKIRIIQKVNRNMILFSFLTFIILFTLENILIQNNIATIPIVEFQISYWIGAPLLFIIVMKKSKFTSTKNSLSFYSMIIYFIHPIIILFLLKLVALQPTPMTFLTIIFSITIAYLGVKLKQSIHKWRKNRTF